jgi:AcrR family transcriptional regulator
VATAAETGKTSKSEQTKSLILETALAIFRERGYEETTMRAIAERANVSLGNAYYYFRSKEHLIQDFYRHTHDEHLKASLPILNKEKTLKNRLLGVMRVKIDTLEPYHAFSGVLFKTAADPKSPLNPFSAESIPTRLESAALFREVYAGVKTKVPEDLDAELANLLWIYHMGVILFWIHDASPERKRTRLLVERTVDIITKLISIASSPLMRPLRRKILKFLAELRETSEAIADGLPAKKDEASERRPDILS